MPSVLTRAGGPAARSGRSLGGDRGSRQLPPRIRRRPALMLAGVAITALGSLTTIWRVHWVTRLAPVLEVVRAVPVGSVVQDADLGVAGLPQGSDLAHLAASRRGDVVGKVATSDLVQGSLLAPGQVGDAVVPRAGQVLTVLALPAARVPAVGLRPGASILVVATPTVQGDLPDTTPAGISAQVVKVGQPDPTGSVAVDVLVAADDGPTVAARSATGRVAVVVQPARAG